MKLIVTTTTKDNAPLLVEQMLTDKMVACGNILDVSMSIYKWKGEVCREPEALVLMETSDDKILLAIEHLSSIHPYETPKILTIEPTMIHAAYNLWVSEETK